MVLLRESCCVSRLQVGAAREMTFWPPRDARGQKANSKVKLAFAQNLQELDPRRRCHENGLCIKRFETMISNCSVGSKAQRHALAEMSLAVLDEHIESSGDAASQGWDDIERGGLGGDVR